MSFTSRIGRIVILFLGIKFLNQVVYVKSSLPSNLPHRPPSAVNPPVRRVLRFASSLSGDRGVLVWPSYGRRDEARQSVPRQLAGRRVSR